MMHTEANATGITIPKSSDNWRAKLAIQLFAIAAAYFFGTPEYVRYALAMVAAYVYINGVELQKRALMINIMDYQLIHVSAQADRLERELSDTDNKLSQLEIAFENYKQGY